MLLRNKKVAIIGGGPVGLTMARLLQQKGIAVTVYERDKDQDTRISGGTLDLHQGSGQDSLSAAGLLEKYFAKALPMGRTVADERGIVLFTRKPSPEDQFDSPEINRNDLRTLLLDSLVPRTVEWDRKLSTLVAREEKWHLYFEGEEKAMADVVIGANGGMSNVRQYITDATIEYTGTIILQGDVPQPEKDCPAFLQLCDDNIIMISNSGSSLVANPKNGSIMSYSLIFKQPPEWDEKNHSDLADTKSIITFLTNRLSHWDECYKQLIRATSSFVVWSTRKISLDMPWKTDRPLPITLIGDAAHIMPPFAGQGVNIGMLDALILSENLTSGSFSSIESAIEDYEKQMLIYASKAQHETSENEAAIILPGFSFMKFYS